MCFKRQILLLTALLTLQLCVCYPVKEYDEPDRIKEFFNDVDAIYVDGYIKKSNLIIDFFNGCIEAVPRRERGATTAILINYKNELVKARDSGDKHKMQDAITAFDQCQELLLASLTKKHKEDEILQLKLQGLLDLIMKMIESKKSMQQQVMESAAELRQQFSFEGVRRHKQLFDILDEMQTNTDKRRAEELNLAFEEQKEKYQSILVNENEAIVDFFYAVDRLKLKTYKNVANVLLLFLARTLNEVPQRDRDSTTAILQDYKHDVESAKYSNNADRLERTLKSFQLFKNHLNANTKRMTNEDRIILTQLESSTEVTEQLKQAEKSVFEKEMELADNLRNKFFAAGLKRHQKFFDVLEELKKNNDAAKTNEISNKYEELREKYLTENQ